MFFTSGLPGLDKGPFLEPENKFRIFYSRKNRIPNLSVVKECERLILIRQRVLNVEDIVSKGFVLLITPL